MRPQRLQAWDEVGRRSFRSGRDWDSVYLGPMLPFSAPSLADALFTPLLALVLVVTIASIPNLFMQFFTLGC
jgi:hypothetical protein